MLYFLQNVTEELRRYFPREVWTPQSNNQSYNPMQIGIILQHNDCIYTATLGCQSIMVILENTLVVLTRY